MGSIWDLADIGEIEFAAKASLLAIHRQQQSTTSSSEQQLDIDDDSDTAENERDVTAVSSTPRLKNKFLDRLAELLAREKSDPWQPKRKDSQHIAATAWVNHSESGPLTIIAAKNGGLDDRDNKMLSHLKTWARAISHARGRVPSISTDALWIGKNSVEGLLEYSRIRLQYLISTIRQLDDDVETMAPKAGLHGPVVNCLRSLCRNFQFDTSKHQLSHIVNIAYQIRYIDWKSVHSSKEARALRAIHMLGRIRAAYECFKTTVLGFPEFKTVEMKPATVNNRVEINTTRFIKQLSVVAAEYGFSKSIIKSKPSRKFTTPSALHVHAEIQVLLSLERDSRWQRDAHKYIGTSRNSCFLCHQFIQHYVRLSMSGLRSPVYQTRGTHGIIYPLWTVPAMSAARRPNTDISIPTAVRETYLQMGRALEDDSTRRPAIAQSSAGVTQSEVSPLGPSRLRRQHLARQREQIREVPKITKAKSIFHKKITTASVYRLPANGEEPDFVSIDFFDYNSIPSKVANSMQAICDVPNFGKYWGDSQLKRRSRKISAEKQEIDALNGDYFVYWNETDDLPDNEYLKNLLGIEKVEFARRFWYGDVFIARVYEHPSYKMEIIDVPKEVQYWDVINGFFQNMWETSFLEDELRQDAAQASYQEKREADMDIILGRMTYTEREVLKKLPPNTLEILASMRCDDGALLDASMKINPDDPTQYMFEHLQMPTALESQGWTGFDSSQL